MLSLVMNTKKITAAAGLGIVAIGLGVSTVACSGTQTVTRTTPGPTVTQTQNVPGPTVTETQTVAPPAPPAGTQVGTYTGHGNETTAAFNVPDSGDYVVTWSYSGNVDDSFGDSMADNFSASMTGTGGFSGDMPNVVQASGSGSTEVTGDSGVESINVEANSAATWTFTVTSAN